MTKFLVSIGLLVPTLVACSDPARCVEASRVPVMDAATPLVVGGTYADVLATLVGARSGAMRWLDTQAHVDGFPAEGATAITVTIAEPVETWNVDRTRDGGGRNERLACPDVVETELAVELQSDDGELEMSATLAVELQAPDRVTFLVDITDEDLGSLVWNPVDPDASLLLMGSYVMGGAAEGALRLRTGGGNEADGAGMSVDLATWTLDP